MSNVEGKPKAQMTKRAVPALSRRSDVRHSSAALFTAGNHLSFTLSRLFSRPDRERGGASFHLVLRLRD